MNSTKNRTLISGCRSDAAGNEPQQFPEEDHMLWTIAAVLIILWLLGLMSGYAMGYFIHISLVIAIVIILIRIIQGQKPI